MLDFDLIKNVLIVAIGSSIITTALVQKIKESMITNKTAITYVSLGVSLIIGTLFSKCFSDLSWLNCLWAGLITWIGADMVYKAFEDKIFKSFSSMEQVVELEREDEQ